MRVFKREQQDGHRYYVDFRDHNGRRHRLAGFRGKRATRQLAYKIERLVAHRTAGEPPPPDLSRWVDSLPRRLLDKLAEWAIISKRRAGRTRTL